MWFFRPRATRARPATRTTNEWPLVPAGLPLSEITGYINWLYGEGEWAALWRGATSTDRVRRHGAFGPDDDFYLERMRQHPFPPA